MQEAETNLYAQAYTPPTTISVMNEDNIQEMLGRATFALHEHLIDDGMTSRQAADRVLENFEPRTRTWPGHSCLTKRIRYAASPAFLRSQPNRILA